ncbi:MAG: nitronate monooxygenase [Boseongicola sp.]|nr:MAG: nitronate monooxygenase [Boseongicola sp.]
MTNRLCDTLNIDRPIILAPMGGAVGPKMVGIVSNEGGLGTIPLWRSTPDQIRAAVADIRDRTDKPFAVNLNVGFPHEDQIDACLSVDVPIISLFWGMSEAAIARVKAGGAKAMVTVCNAAEARQAIDAGADVLVAQGWEAGGHVWGVVASMALIPAVVDVAGDVPVVAAGGISDGRAMAAAMALGASGVWVGTRFLAAEELDIHEVYRQRILEAGEDDSFYSANLFDHGWENAPHRALKNSVYAQWMAEGRPEPGSRSLEGSVIGQNSQNRDVLRYQSHTPSSGDTGEIEAMSMWAGQGVAQVREVMPAAKIMDELEAGAAQVIQSLRLR